MRTTAKASIDVLRLITCRTLFCPAVCYNAGQIHSTVVGIKPYTVEVEYLDPSIWDLGKSRPTDACSGDTLPKWAFVFSCAVI